jgi:hypothetical protein
LGDGAGVGAGVGETAVSTSLFESSRPPAAGDEHRLFS